MFKCRCSKIGDINTNPQNKKDALSKTAINYLMEWANENWSGRKEEIISKYLTKGIVCEDDSIKLASDVLFMNFQKNEKSFENNYLTGTPDLIGNDFVYDIKTSWHPKTFPKFYAELPEKSYYGQVQGYLALTGKQKGGVIYCLVSAPDHLIYDELNRLKYKLGLPEITDEIEEVVRHNMTFDDIPEVERVKIYAFDRDEDYIKATYSKVEECRKYLQSIGIEPIFEKGE
jgi:hypothetical protein